MYKAQEVHSYLRQFSAKINGRTCENQFVTLSV